MTFLLTLSSVSVFASPVARVIEVSGNAFVFTEGSSVQTLKYGDKIKDLSEVMVEDDSKLSVVTDRGHLIYFTGGSLVKFANSVTELKNGQIWVKAEGDLSQGLVYTGNSIVNYTEGEFIYSFNNTSGKSQLLVLTGEAKFSNKIEPSLKINVASGHFSFVEQEFEKSLPRTPLKVGLDSYKKFTTLFAGFKTMENSNLEGMWGSKPESQKRSIASVEDQFTRTVKVPVPSKVIPKKRAKTPGKITIIRSPRSRVPASASPAEYYKSFTQKNKKKVVKKSTKAAPIKYYGFKKAPSKSAVKRIPASVKKPKIVREIAAPKQNAFENSFNQNIEQNPRHSSEVNSLIDELKSYKQDYKKQY